MPRPKTPKRLGMYADVKEVLDAALRSRGGTYQLESYGLAVNWRHRAYQFRKLYAELNTISPYDRLTLKRIEPGSTIVEIRMIGERQQGKFTPAGPAVAEAPDDDLLEIGRKLAEKIDKGEPL